MAAQNLSHTWYILIIYWVFFWLAKAEDQWDFDFDNVPGVAHDFKVNLEPGKIDCYYQHVILGATFYVAFQGMRGGDRFVGMLITAPSGFIVRPYAWNQEGEFNEIAKETGYFEICIDNRFGRFATKLVYLYIATFELKKWEEYSDELQTLDLTVGNFTESIHKVDGRINDMLQYQVTSRRHLVTDWHTIRSNNKYVQYWSLAQCIVIVVSSALQVFFVRRLFNIKNVTPTAKPRA